MKDQLGDRIKGFYEDRTRFLLPRRNYTIIRVDGKAFHTYTKGLEVPFDQGLIEDMDETAAYLCKNIQGAKFAYVQSDEISILLTDFDTQQTDMWFDGNVQKMASVSASLATARFNQLRMIRFANGNIDPMASLASSLRDQTMSPNEIEKFKMACFDARVFQIPSPMEVENYFIWRQQDATRNSISSAARAFYSHKELNGKTSDEKQEMIFQKGINWNDYPTRCKRGGVIAKENSHWAIPVDPNNSNKPTGKAFKCESESQAATLEFNEDHKIFVRSEWTPQEIPIFTQDRDFLRSLIPKNYEI